MEASSSSETSSTVVLEQPEIIAETFAEQEAALKSGTQHDAPDSAEEIARTETHDGRNEAALLNADGGPVVATTSLDAGQPDLEGPWEPATDSNDKQKPRKRPRKMTAKQEEEERNRSYRASQKLLRKNASTLSIKDALSRSMTVQEVTVDSQPLPLSTIDHPTSSSSSPATALPQLGVHDITARFLMKVRSSRSLTIDNILRKDKSQQMINTSVDSARDGLFPDLEAAELLVLEDENANAAAPLVKEPLLSSLLASGRLDEASRGTTTTVMAKEGPARESQRTLSDDEREAEHDRITAQLRRKHEMLRLRSAAAVDSRSLPSSLHASLTPKLPLTDSLHSLPSSPLSTEVVGPGPKKVMESATGSAVSALLPAGMSSMALRQAGLQQRAANFLKAVQGDVQLLKRTNSFENSAQKPIVFAASEKVKKAPSGSNT